MKKPNLGLRLRVALALALTCLLVVGALGFTLYMASEDMEESLIDQLVADEMDYLIKWHQQDPHYAPQQSSNLHAYIVRSTREQAQLPDHLRNLGPGQHELFVDQDEFHVLVREQGGIRYYVAYEVGLHEQREQEFKLLVLLSVLTAALASLALGYWVSGMLVRQVTQLAARVGALKPGQDHEKLIQPGQDPEVAMLARAFEDYQSSIDRMIRREQEFTSNASHELRTPLTAIKTSSEMLLADPTLGEKSRVRVEWINAAAGRMAEQIQALLFLARGQALGEIEPVVIADCVAEATEPYRAEIARKRLAFKVDIAGDVVIDLNHQALRFVLANLLRNAVQYTERGSVRVSYAGRRLTVTDSGRGIERQDLPHVFDRHFRAADGTEGSGLGLSIVQRICHHYGWKVEIASAPAQGSTFSIVFP